MKRFGNCLPDFLADILLLGKSHIGLGRMNVDVKFFGIQFKKKRRERIFMLHHICRVCVFNRLIQKV